MNKELEEKLKYLKLKNLLNNFDRYMEELETSNMSAIGLLDRIIAEEYEYKKDKSLQQRLTSAKMPCRYSIETFPFNDQKHVDKKRLLNRYDSLDYIDKNKSLIFIGNTGSGKTGLATSFLMNAINQGYSGRFVSFFDLMEELYQSKADNSGKVVLSKYSKIDCLCIDDVGRMNLEKSQINLFYNLIQQRYKKKCTLITTHVGLKEWDSFIGDKHLTSAIVDRLIDGGHVIHLKDCKSLRKKPDIDSFIE